MGGNNIWRCIVKGCDTTLLPVNIKYSFQQKVCARWMQTAVCDGGICESHFVEGMTSFDLFTEEIWNYLID